MNHLIPNQLLISQLTMLLKREFWENRTTFFYLPLTIALVTIALVLTSLATASFVRVDINQADINQADINQESPWQDADSDYNENLSYDDALLKDILGPTLVRFSQQRLEVREAKLGKLLLASAAIPIIALWLVAFFYLQGALYNDRKDRSILFWKSLPVSDSLTVGSKLLAALIVLPAIYFCFIILIQLSFLIIASFAALGYSVDVWQTLWVPGNLFSRWFGFISFYLFSLLWCLPFYSWLLLVSSWVKSVPLAWLVGVPLLVVILEGVLFSGSHYIAQFISSHSLSLSRDGGLYRAYMTGNVFSYEMIVALVLGASFIALAIWKRGRVNET